MLWTVNNEYGGRAQDGRDSGKLISPKEVQAAMAAAGFGAGQPADSNKAITTYSGGWKVKMQLLAAQLMEAEILMLDEPTGHMDDDNKDWMMEWLGKYQVGLSRQQGLDDGVARGVSGRIIGPLLKMRVVASRARQDLDFVISV